MRDDTIPGRSTLLDWEIEPVRPLRLKDHAIWRDGWATLEFWLEDAEGNEFRFFFDGFLGRLCWGTDLHTGDDAAFVKKGTRVEADVFETLFREMQANDGVEAVIGKRVRKALQYAGWTASA